MTIGQAEEKEQQRKINLRTMVMTRGVLLGVAKTVSYFVVDGRLYRSEVEPINDVTSLGDYHAFCGECREHKLPLPWEP